MSSSAPGIERIVVGVDGSEHARAALEWAVGMARLTGAEIVAVHAVHEPAFAYAYPYAVPLRFDPEWRAAVRREFEDEWCAPLAEARVRYRTLFEDGRPAPVIASAAERLDADLVVVGRRGRGGFAELVLGSVSHELSHHCRRPVLLVTAARTARQPLVGAAAQTSR
jgi:nucleotide-binding universal stress UspA family protein